MKRIQIGIIVLFIISLFACGTTKNTVSQMDNTPVSNIEDGWTSTSENGYTIKYPEDWQFDNSGIMGMPFLILSPILSDDDTFRENVNLMEEDLAGKGIDINQYAEISEDLIKKFITDVAIIKSAKTANENIHQMIYTGKQGVLDLKFMQYYQIIDEKAYVLTLTCEVNEFDNYKDTGEKIMNSFKLIDE